MFACCVLGQGS